VPIKKTYTFDWWKNPPVPDAPEQRYVPMHYVLKNNKANRLGLFPLQSGKVRIFQEDGHGDVAFLGEDWGAFTPIDDDLKLYVGLARDIVCKRRITTNDYRAVRGNLYDRDVVISYEIQNFKKTAATLDIVEDLNLLRDELCGHKPGIDVEWELGEETSANVRSERKDAHTAVAHMDLEKAGEPVQKHTLTLNVTLKNVW
jgi:hypothetical protein